jgi:hypothetical protein
MAFLECIVCCSSRDTGEYGDKRIFKTTCTPLCLAVLLAWARLPDPRPSLYQCYLKAKMPVSDEDMLDEVEKRG